MNHVSIARRVFLIVALALRSTGASEPMPRVTNAELDALAQAAFRAAAARVAPSVVRIETTGGLEKVGAARTGNGPTTGIVVDSEGWILSSTFNFAHRPAGIVVTLPDGKRFAAKPVGTDHARRLTLLKIDATGLPVPAAVPCSEMRAGQWAMALGRAWSLETPSISIGIVSVLDRHWGKALQTDAKVSPVNYGGPLVDLRGQVFGILVPLSKQGRSPDAGVELYDSGIGFAVPWEDSLRTLDRLQTGDLHAGLAGVTFDVDTLDGPPAIAMVGWRSPAEKSGLRPGDRVKRVDGRSIRHDGDFRIAIGSKYAGETVAVTVDRAGAKLRRQVELVEQLPVYIRPFLGIFPKQAGEKAGSTVADVVPGGPAAKVGMRAGDVILAVGGKAIEDDADLRKRVDEQQVGAPVRLAIDRSGERVVAIVTPTAFPDALPFAPPNSSSPDEKRQDAEADVFERDSSSSETPYWMIVPSGRDPDRPRGLVLCFGIDGGPTRDELVAAWKPICARFDLLLLSVEPMNRAGWESADIDRATAAFDEVRGRFRIDRSRVVAHGFGPSASIAERFAQRRRELVRGLYLVAGGRLEAGPTHPDAKLAYFVEWTAADPRAEQFQARADALRQRHIPVTTRTRATPLSTNPTSRESELIGQWVSLLGAL